VDKFIYRLWSDGTTVGEWGKPDEAHQGTRDYMRSNPEEIRSLQLSFCQQTSDGMKILSTVRGYEIEQYLEDVGLEVDDDEDGFG